LVQYPSKIKSSSESESALVAKEFMLSCKKGDRVVLNGNLGAGKTFFIKAALSSIGIKNVNSPSFAIVNEYQNNFHIYHFDFYRLKNSSELSRNPYFHLKPQKIFVVFASISLMKSIFHRRSI